MTEVAQGFEPGTEVRIKSDPGRVGVVLKKTRHLDETLYQQVRFADGPQFLRISDLESTESSDDDPLDLLSAGKFGRARDLRRLLTHIRLSGRLANLIYSMETTNTDFYPYQFKPVLNFLDSPSGGLLIADEVGLGKTIEAGLIWTELRSRFDARRLLILCPAVLREKWRNELFLRFGIDAEIVNAAEAARKLEEVRQGRRRDIHLIGSLQGLAPRRGWTDPESRDDGRTRLARMLAESQFEDPIVDLVVIDEAHYLRNPETMSAHLGRLLRGITEHMILLSATPVHLKSNDLYQLLNLVDEDTFNVPRLFDEILEANAPLLQARELVLKDANAHDEIDELLAQAAAHPLLSNSRQLADVRKTLNSEGSKDHDTRARLANRLERLNLLGHAVTRTRKRDVTEWRVIREPVAESVTLDPSERAFYDKVTHLVREYCGRRDAHEGFLLVTPQRQVSSSMAASLADWQRRAELAGDDLEDFLEADSELPNRPGPLVGELLRNARNLADLQQLRRVDTKYRRLVAMLTDYLGAHPKEKVILFSTFKATLRYLEERLTQDGLDATLLMGGMAVDKQEVIEGFRRKNTGGVLLASEVASEGVDLQFARVLINYDLPWNPMKVEQRIGRIDRIGQPSPKITIWNMINADTIDDRIYSRLYGRLGIFERALGGLEAVLGDEIRTLTMDLLRGSITEAQEEARIEQTATAIANLRKMEADLEDEAANLIAHGDYILQQVRAAREMNRWISGNDLCSYVLDFFNGNFPGCEFRQRQSDALVFDVRLSEEARYELERFLTRHRLQGETRLAANISDFVRCEFINRVSPGGRKNVEYISQFHPLVRFVSEAIRGTGEAFHGNVGVRLARTEVPEVPGGDYVFVVDHWSLKGLRVIERLNYEATRINGDGVYLDSSSAESLVTAAALHGRDWLGADTAVDLSAARKLAEQCLTRTIRSYDEYLRETENENSDRIDLQLSSLQRHSARQLERLHEVRARHVANGRDALVRATDGRIRKLEERVSRKTKDIESSRNLNSMRRDISVGLIRVE